MELHLIHFLIVCPFVFLAGLVDAIGGGGGLISLPAYLIAGVPIHMSIATNKLSSCCGTMLATGRFIKNKMINFKIGIPSVIAAVIGSSIGAKLSLVADEKILQIVLLVALPVTAFFVLNKKLFPEIEEHDLNLNDPKLYVVVCISALIIGMYDGFYGPGTGTFLIIAFTLIGKMDMKKANSQAKLINLTTNLTSLVVFALSGQVVVLLGIAAALCNMLGAYIGAGLAMNKGSKIIRPCIILVLGLLFLKVLGVY
ncbi:MAG: TSUP family transporter [Dorea sp.]|nr:TSUP family transporter [Dorea sp.]